MGHEDVRLKTSLPPPLPFGSSVLAISACYL